MDLTAWPRATRAGSLGETDLRVRVARRLRSSLPLCRFAASDDGKAGGRRSSIGLRKSCRAVLPSWNIAIRSIELEHLRRAGEILRKYDKRDPKEMSPQALPTPFRFQSNKQYVNSPCRPTGRILCRCTNCQVIIGIALPANGQCTGGADWASGLSTYLSKGQDYRFQSEGNHPVQELGRRNT